MDEVLRLPRVTRQEIRVPDERRATFADQVVEHALPGGHDPILSPSRTADTS